MGSRNGSARGGSVKVQRRTLADGTVKEYRYERKPKRPRRPDGDLRGIFNRYCESPEFTGLAKAWQERKLWLYRLIENELGWMTVADLEDRRSRSKFYELRDRHAKLPHRADKLMQALASSLAWAYDRGMITVNHAQRIKPLVDWKKSPHRDKFYTEEQEQEILAEAPDDLTRLYLFALYTGFRRGDLVAMPPSALHRDGWLVWRPSKTTKSTNVTVHLPTFEFPALAALVKDLPATGKRLLLTGTGVPWTEANISHRWRRLVQSLGMDGMRFHDIRHTTSNRLIGAGCTEAERGIIMGNDVATGSGRAYVARTRELAVSAYRKWHAHLARGTPILALPGAGAS